MQNRRAVNFTKVEKITLVTHEETWYYVYRKPWIGREGWYGRDICLGFFWKVKDSKVTETFRVEDNVAYKKPYIEITGTGYNCLHFEDVETASVEYAKLVLKHELVELNSIENPLVYE